MKRIPFQLSETDEENVIDTERQMLKEELEDEDCDWKLRFMIMIIMLYILDFRENVIVHQLTAGLDSMNSNQVYMCIYICSNILYTPRRTTP